MNSSDGRRLILRIAKAGEVLEMASAVSGAQAEMSAETLYPSRIAVIERPEFLGFLARHPEVYQILTVEISRNLNRTYEQLRTVGLRPPRRRSWPACCWTGAKPARRQKPARASTSRSPTKRLASSSAPRARR